MIQSFGLIASKVIEYINCLDIDLVIDWVIYFILEINVEIC